MVKDYFILLFVVIRSCKSTRKKKPSGFSQQTQTMFITNINLMNFSTIVSFVSIQNVHHLCYCYHVIWKEESMMKEWKKLASSIVVATGAFVFEKEDTLKFCSEFTKQTPKC
jgi:hypothetical protein